MCETCETQDVCLVWTWRVHTYVSYSEECFVEEQNHPKEEEKHPEAGQSHPDLCVNGKLHHKQYVIFNSITYFLFF